MLDVLSKYYEDVVIRRKVLENDLSINVLRDIEKLKFDGDEITKFKLYEEQPNVSVFVEYDEEAEELRGEIETKIKCLKQLMKSDEKDLKEIMKVRSEIRGLVIKLGNYLISDFPDRLPTDEYDEWKTLGIYMIHRNRVEELYDNATGLRHREELGISTSIID